MENEIGGASIASFIFGIISLIIFPLLFGIIAVICGVVSEKNGFAIAGIILGIIGIVFRIFIMPMMY